MPSCGKIEELAQRLLGFSGSTVAVFLRLPNRADARLAAKYVGRELTFVVGGVSITEGHTANWNDAYREGQPDPEPRQELARWGTTTPVNRIQAPTPPAAPIRHLD